MIDFKSGRKYIIGLIHLPPLPGTPFYQGDGMAPILRKAVDDALALVIAHVSGWRLSRCYLFTDVTVLLLSLSYIPFQRIFFSLITVTVSSWLIDRIQRADLPRWKGCCKRR